MDCKLEVRLNVDFIVHYAMTNKPYLADQIAKAEVLFSFSTVHNFKQYYHDLFEVAVHQ